MRKLEDFVNEKLKVSANHYKPKDLKELIQIVKDAVVDDNEADLNFIDTSLITSMNSLFEDIDFDGDISNWDVSNVKDMDYMFYTSNFTGKNSPSMDKWDVSNVETMDSMFEQSKFEQDISGWEIDPSCSTDAMFAHCPLSNKHEFIPQCLLRRI
jgi:hypothetical protein